MIVTKTLTMLTKHRESFRRVGQVILWQDHRAVRCSSTIGIHTADGTLDGRADRCIGRDIVGQHLVHDVLRSAAGVDIRIPVAARRHEVFLGDGVGGSSGQINWSTCAAPIGCLAYRSDNATTYRSGDVINSLREVIDLPQVFLLLETCTGYLAANG